MSLLSLTFGWFPTCFTFVKICLIDRPHLITLAAFIWKKTENGIIGDFSNPTLTLCRGLGVGYFVPNDYFLIHLGAFNTPEAVTDTSLLHNSHCNSPCPLYIFWTPCKPSYESRSLSFWGCYNYVPLDPSWLRLI